ncbi:SusC/RagA family TonB-linked outer membrane protein [Roseivirga sp. BDSF3-8]|uniref:SusC/RagA family TonB-linked outer membrane protein n=1 Tax=Roseivirga sp. BDSF3-8 TaxID=3241598 RepID=UPI003531F701
MRVKLLILSLLALALLMQEAMAQQQRPVSGKVTDAADGSGLPGASVVIKGTTRGTVTDVDGNYRLNLPEGSGDVIVFSYVGYETVEEAVNGRTTINIAMEEASLVTSEVVITAIGIEREKDAIGYASESLDAERIQKKAEPDPVRTLQGKVPGVNIIGGGGSVGSGTNITIRGNSSLLGNNQPLFVVDGVPFDNTSYETGSFTSGTASSSRSFDLDPNNIESVNVLKGAAAAALYGSRAANGVVVITTKTGRKGTKKGLEVSFNSSFIVEEVANLPDLQMRYTGGNNFLYVDGNFGTWGAPFAVDTTSGAWAVNDNKNLILGYDDNGNPLVAHPYDQYADRAPEFTDARVPLVPHNNAEDFFQTGYLLENGLTISGGGPKANFVAGISRMDNEGIVPGNKAERTNVNIGGNVQLDNGLFSRGSITYTRNELDGFPTTGFFTGGVSITERILWLPPNLGLKSYPYQDVNGDQLMYRPSNNNPYFLINNAPHNSLVDRYYGKLSVGFDFTDWLTAEYQMGFNTYTDKRNYTLPISTVGVLQGQVTLDEIRYEELDGNLLITGNRDLNEKLNLRVILGHQVNQRTFNRQSVVGNSIIVRGINDIDNTSTVTPNGGGFERRRYHGVFGDVSLSYMNWAYLNVTARNDWTSALPPDERSYFYGGVSGSVIFSRALGLESDWFEYGKLRAGYASVGNDTDAYLTSTIFGTNPSLGNNIADFVFPFQNTNGQTLSGVLGNDALRPEITAELELGTELRFLRGRIGLDFTYYDRRSKDQIVPISLPASSGFTSRIGNIGEVSNKGVEIGLNLVPVELENSFRWSIYSAFTRNKNVVEDLGPGVNEIFVAGFGNGVQVVHRVGEEFGLIQGSVAARGPNGELLVDPTTGKLITALQPDIIGNPNPDFLLGVTNTFSYKGLELGFLIDYRHGGDMWSATFNQLYGRGVTTGTIPDHPDGREVTLVIPGVVGDPSTLEAVLDENGNTIRNGTQLTTNDWWFINTFGSAGPNEFSVFDATTIRLREVTLGYSLPASVLEKTPFGSARITLSGRNLWFKALHFPDDLNFDPETSSLGAGNVRSTGGGGASSGNAQGVDFGVVPTAKRYGVNLSITF